MSCTLATPQPRLSSTVHHSFLCGFTTYTLERGVCLYIYIFFLLVRGGGRDGGDCGVGERKYM